MQIKVRCTQSVKLTDSYNTVNYIKGDICDIDYVDLYNKPNERIFLVSKDHAMNCEDFFNYFEEVEVTYVTQFICIVNGEVETNMLDTFDDEYQCKRYIETCATKVFNRLRELKIGTVPAIIKHCPFKINIEGNYFIANYKCVVKTV